MKLVEIYFWDSVFWLFYLPISLILQIATEQGTVMGIVFIGLAFTVVLSLILALMDGIIWDDWEPAVVIAAVPTPAPMAEVIETKEVKPRKKRTPKAEPIPEPVPVPDEEKTIASSKPVEVKPNEQKETRQEPESTDSSRSSVGVDEEPKPKMWTDVDLDELDADDDDALS